MKQNQPNTLSFSIPFAIIITRVVISVLHQNHQVSRKVEMETKVQGLIRRAKEKREENQKLGIEPSVIPRPCPEKPLTAREKAQMVARRNEEARNRRGELVVKNYEQAALALMLHQPRSEGGLILTNHAQYRMIERGITKRELESPSNIGNLTRIMDGNVVITAYKNK